MNEVNVENCCKILKITLQDKYTVDEYLLSVNKKVMNNDEYENLRRVIQPMINWVSKVYF